MADRRIISLEDEAPFIEELRRSSGAPALSLGVFHHGRIVYTKHFGRRDITHPDPPTDDTVYYLASVSKCIGICAVARLVSDGVLDWDIPIRNYLPEFHRPNDDFGREVTLRDLACHRTGMPLANFWWGQMEGEALLNTAQLVRQACYLQTIKPFRSAFYYSNWNYVLIHAVVEKVTGKPFAAVVNELMLVPLGLKHTTFHAPPATPHLAPPYAVRNDGTVSVIAMNPLDSATGLNVSMGGKGTMKDMLGFFSALLSAYTSQKDNGVDNTPETPFRQVCNIFAPQVLVGPESSSSYCLGIYRTKLPGILSCASLNAPLLGQDLPIFGRSSPDTEVFHHTGNLPGSFGSYFLLPGTQSGVVCLTNSTPLFDPTDFAAQIALGVLLGENKPDNLLALGQLATKTQIGWFKNINAYLSKKRTSVPPSLPLGLYAGTYVNRAGNFILVVTPTVTGLHIAVQGSSKTTYDVEPLTEDTFCWVADRDRQVCRGMFPYPFAPLHIIKFWVRESWVDRLIWHTDMLTKPDVFRRTSEGGEKL
jgi:CubicO group peptidase (beta-lactamase class C family)